MTRAALQSLVVPAAVFPLLASLPFAVSVWPSWEEGEGPKGEFKLIEGPQGWGARAGDRYHDEVSVSVYSCATLREAVRDALLLRAEKCASTALVHTVAAKRLRNPFRKGAALTQAEKLRADAAQIQETMRALEAAWPEESAPRAPGEPE